MNMNPSLQARITAVDWASKGFPDAPQWLNNLFSEDKTLAGLAFNKLDEYVARGGIDFENFDLRSGIEVILRTDAPDILVDIVIQFLHEPQPLDPVCLIDLLLTQSLYVDFKFRDSTDSDLKRRASAIYQKIWDARASFIPFLKHADDEVRAETALLLCQFRDKPDEVIPLIVGTAAVETASYPLVWYLQSFTMSFLKRGKINEAHANAYFALLNDLLLSPLGLVVQVVAAYHLLEQLGDKTSVKVLDKLVEGMLVEFDHDITLLIMAARVDVQSRLLMKLPPDRALPLLLKVLNQTMQIRNALYALLAALCVACEPPASDVYLYLLQPTPHDGRIFYYASTMGQIRQSKFLVTSLTPTQKRVIQAAVKNDLIWTVGTDLFDLFGLPSDRDALRSLIA
jgi:hypothetical protein